MEIRVSATSHLIGVPLADLSVYLPKELLICVIETKGGVIIGKGDCILSPGDTIIVFTSPIHIKDLEHLF